MTSDSTSSQDAKIRLQTALLSLVASVLILAFKAAGAMVSGSSAALSDALESIVNVIAAGVALAVIRFVSAPADREHPYGHGKAEFLSASFEGGLIAFAAVIIFLESCRALWKGPELRELDLGLAFLAGAAVLNLLLGLYVGRVARRMNSEALQASGAHILSDVKTTVGVIFGLGLVKLTGWSWLDPVMAILVSLQLAWEGWRIVRRSLAGLIDEMDETSLESLSKAILRHRVPGVIELHHLRAIRSGGFHHIDAHLVVPEFWDVRHVHEVTHDFERKVVADYHFDGEFAFHLDPCRRAFCRLCDVVECPIRQHPFEKIASFDVKSLIGAPAVS